MGRDVTLQVKQREHVDGKTASTWKHRFGVALIPGIFRGTSASHWRKYGTVPQRPYPVPGSAAPSGATVAVLEEIRTEATDPRAESSLVMLGTSSLRYSSSLLCRAQPIVHPSRRVLASQSLARLTVRPAVLRREQCHDERRNLTGADSMPTEGDSLTVMAAFRVGAGGIRNLPCSLLLVPYSLLLPLSLP